MPDTKYPLAERFKAVQGEGLFAGTPMAFLRFVGCSVGQKVCTHCDTDFSKQHTHLGGGLYSAPELVEWIGPDYRHVCLTGGEPLDRDLKALTQVLHQYKKKIHLETSGTKHLPVDWYVDWVTVSPKPGYHPSMISRANEVKVIHGGLGIDTLGWPTLQQAIDWANGGKLVYLQARNKTKTIDVDNTDEVVELVKRFPQLRLSCQLHKYLGER